MEKTFENLKKEDERIRQLVEALDGEDTSDAVKRVVYGWITQYINEGFSWESAAKGLADDFGFEWRDTRHDGPFEVPLREAWAKDRQCLKECEAELLKIKAKQSNSN